MQRQHKKAKGREDGNPEREVSDKGIDKLVRKLEKYNGNLARVALNLAAVLADINNPDMGKAVLLFDCLQRIREYIDKHYGKASRLPSSSEGPLGVNWERHRTIPHNKVVE